MEEGDLNGEKRACWCVASADTLQATGYSRNFANPKCLYLTSCEWDSTINYVSGALTNSQDKSHWYKCISEPVLSYFCLTKGVESVLSAWVKNVCTFLSSAQRLYRSLPALTRATCKVIRFNLDSGRTQNQQKPVLLLLLLPLFTLHPSSSTELPPLLYANPAATPEAVWCEGVSI